MLIDKKTPNSGFRVVVKKSGTYVIWYDATFKAQRHLNLSKMNNNKYFGTGRGCR